LGGLYRTAVERLGVRARGGDGGGRRSRGAGEPDSKQSPGRSGERGSDRRGPRARERKRGRKRSERIGLGARKWAAREDWLEREGGRARARGWAGEGRWAARGGEGRGRRGAAAGLPGEKGRKGEEGGGRLGWAQRRREGEGKRKKKDKCFRICN
jgi:hypothetical protein